MITTDIEQINSNFDTRHNQLVLQNHVNLDSLDFGLKSLNDSGWHGAQQKAAAIKTKLDA